MSELLEFTVDKFTFTIPTDHRKDYGYWSVMGIWVSA